ncbi:hypothetical protein KDL01_14405 [Actinospica durhamensis]|uniref:Uncharacterized protein n=1 Tax=Actinospica durhamensis TaxID=1508375 RepID=A0A941IS17_9ACTN|nr:hypothetical protein [Actinospica durhamensis]MBR7834463.1 hypothetical protein [Actinospica durhamensis]
MAPLEDVVPVKTSPAVVEPEHVGEVEERDEVEEAEEIAEEALAFGSEDPRIARTATAHAANTLVWTIHRRRENRRRDAFVAGGVAGLSAGYGSASDDPVSGISDA